MISIKHELRQAMDDINKSPIDMVVSMQESLIKTKSDVEQKIAEMFPDKAHWFNVIIDEGNYNIRITPTATTLGDTDKMRLYQYFINMRGEELGMYARERIHWNMRFAYRSNARGVGYGY